MCNVCGCGAGEARIEGEALDRDGHEHEHVHADGTVHRHAHGHEGEHAHSHQWVPAGAHGHRHQHADGTWHSHDHVHTADHAHPHTDAGDGSLHYNTFLPHILSNEAYRFEEPVNQIVYQHVLACEGTIAAEHGIGQVKNQWLPTVRSEAEIAIMRAIKAAVDPHQIMNPGKLLP